MSGRFAPLVALLLACAAAASSSSAAAGNPLMGDSALPPGLADWKQSRADAAAGRLVVDEDGIPLGIAATDGRTSKPASEVVSKNGRFVVRFRSDDVPPRLNSIHGWDLTLTDTRRRPLEGATVRIYGGMPLHDHGFPTEPSIIDTGAGRYRINGMKFHMAGWWQIILLVTTAEVTDLVVLDVPVRPQVSWTPGERARIGSLSLHKLGPPPPDPSNRFAGDPRAARLGGELFFDPKLSGNGKVSCATCHDPASHFTRPVRGAQGIGTTRRHAPTIVGSAYNAWFYWDGRRDSAWAQALVPLEAPAEMGSTRTAVLRAVAADPALRSAYEAAFGGLPGLEDETRFPQDASPLGSPAERRAWETMSAESRRSIDSAFSNLGKALAAFERTILSRASRFDRYASGLEAGDAGAAAILDKGETAGLRLFISERVGCLRCHNGPLFSNGEFHNIGTVPLDREPLDLGRQAGVAEALTDPFNCLGDDSDAERQDCQELIHTRRGGELAGAFKVPSLRQVAETAPYMHDGQFATLDEVLAHYSRAPQGRLGHQELERITLTPQAQRQIVAFLGTLTEETRRAATAAGP